MDSLLKYFTTVAQLAVQTQIENFLSKKLCEDDNLCKVIEKYRDSFSNQLAIQDLVDDKQELYFKKNEDTNSKPKCMVCQDDIKENGNGQSIGERCKYCNQYFHKSCIKRDDNTEIKRDLCPICSKPFTVEQKCYNIFIHEKILTEFRDVFMSTDDYDNNFTRLRGTLLNMGMMSRFGLSKGGRTRRKRKRRNVTSTKKPSNGNRRKSNNKKQKLKKKKAMKTRKQYPFILVGGGDNNDEKTVQDAVIIAHNVMNRKNPFYKNMPLTYYTLDRPNRLKPILNQKPTTNLTNLKLQKGYLKKELESVAGKFTENFEKARTKMKDRTITDQLFNDPSDGSSDNNQSPDKAGSSGCCQQTPYNDFVKLISLIFNMASIFIKDFFAADQGDKPNDILDKIMEILVSSFKITLPDALGTSFSRHMDKLYQSNQSKTAIAANIKDKTIKRITETYHAPKIKDLRKTVTSKKAM